LWFTVIEVFIAGLKKPGSDPGYSALFFIGHPAKLLLFAIPERMKLRKIREK
jgi:hypothetical protein